MNFDPDSQEGNAFDTRRWKIFPIKEEETTSGGVGRGEGRVGGEIEGEVIEGVKCQRAINEKPQKMEVVFH